MATIVLNNQIDDYITCLVETGLFGETKEQALEGLILAQLRECVRYGLIKPTSMEEDDSSARTEG